MGPQKRQLNSYLLQILYDGEENGVLYGPRHIGFLTDPLNVNANHFQFYFSGLSASLQAIFIKDVKD
jgi:hypothetical protein